jgi:hypothetical protein
MATSTRSGDVKVDPDVLSLTEHELALGIILNDQLLFSMFFQKGELSKPPTTKQRLMFLDQSKRILLCTSRNVAKSICLIGRIARRIATYVAPEEIAGKVQEILVFAPAEGHLGPVIDKLYALFGREPALNALVPSKTRGDKPTMKTKNNLIVYGRIDGTSGTDVNMVGIHPFEIYGDECAFTNEVTHRSRLIGAMPGTRWIYAGVPNDVRGVFYKLDKTEEGQDWSKHNFSVKEGNPLFIASASYRRRLTKAFGGEGSAAYITQVLGQWGDEAASSFPPGAIAWLQASEHPFFIHALFGEQATKMKETLGWQAGLRIPTVQCSRAAIGWDWGYSPDPTTFVVAFQRDTDGPWYTHCRVQLFRVQLPLQIDILRYLVQTVVANKMAMLSTDNIPAYQMLLDDNNVDMFGGRVTLTNLGGKVEVDTTTGEVVTDENRTRIDIQMNKKAGKLAHVGRKYWLTQQLRQMMANALGENEGSKLWLGYDHILESEFTVTVERRRGNYIVYELPRTGRSGSGVPPDQIVDTLRSLVDAIVKADPAQEFDPDYSAVLDEMGFAGRMPPGETYSPPWGQ